MKTEYVKNAQRAFLADTVAFYHTGNRCVFGGACRYSATSSSPGCAIGRHVPDKELCRQWDSSGKVELVSSRAVFLRLPPGLQVLGSSFLRAIQRFHDTERYWDSDGLSFLGRSGLDCLKRAYEL